ncbi:hypothetical protein EIP86_010650 [Pleurotus ostreatoroseus]|nr:hypothetical protein EIP86_010650 [Pleurotus ostreatoroseus]
MQGNQLTVGTAFTAIALFSMLRNPLNVIPSWIVQVLQAGVSLNRISAYLNEDEVDEQVSTLKKATLLADEEMIDGLGLDHATLKWNEIEGISDEDKKTNENPLAATTGSSNEGDSASSTTVDSVSGADTAEARALPGAAKLRYWEMALLGEMTLLSGRLVMSKNPCKVDAHGLQYSISYAAQTPWLRHQSIRDNILFGYPLDEKRYRDVVECCALVPDFENLEDGDMTEIGARGISLSGGQKARVALARAVYAPTKYVLLDDPLSAVDSHTARILFDKLLCGPLLTHRTVILVTHHVELVLPGTHYVVGMLDGRIDTQGTVQELYKRGVLEDVVQDKTLQEAQVVRVVEETTFLADEAEDSKSLVRAKTPRKLVEDEKRETGGVKWDVYKTYLEASSYWTWVILSFLVIFNQLLAVSEKFWIKVWSEAYAETNGTMGLHIIHDASSEPEFQYSSLSSNPVIQIYGISGSLHALIVDKWPAAQEHPLFYISVYALITLGGAVIMTTTTIVLFTGALRASRVLFQKLLVRVTRATMRWHDVTPQGRMLNRFSKDIETIDSSLWGSIRQVNTSMASFIVCAVTIIAIFPLFVIPASLIGYIYYKLAVGYINIGRDLRRMESNTRSPLFSSFGELLEGVVTVRAFSAEQRFLDNHTEKMDLTNKMYYMFWMANRWLLLRFDAVGALVIFITTLFALAGWVEAGLAGVCITSAMTFTSSVYWVCRLWTSLELDLNAVERVVEYLNLPQEPFTVIASSRPPAYWPSSTRRNGNALVSIENLSVRYAPELPTILHDVTLEIKAQERVGLLGRTGSGKSTLAMSLLRFVEPASGRIVIDGIDISQIGLHDLRSHITFIPQDAALFPGTLRDNVDPFNEHEDRECLDVLYRVHLITTLQTEQASPVQAIDHEDAITFLSDVIQPEDNSVIALETLVSPGGSNFSAGQRQLIAIARALLRRSPIIILDEATSSIDFSTDAKIQATIREEFSGSALLTVAHRLHTVIDYDRLVVLDEGKIAENDTPWNLIQKQGGLFRNMCMKSGAFDELQAAAKAKAETVARQA